MSENDELLYEVKGRIAYLTLNRPSRMNAINYNTGPRQLQFPRVSYFQEVSYGRQLKGQIRIPVFMVSVHCLKDDRVTTSPIFP